MGEPDPGTVERIADELRVLEYAFRSHTYTVQAMPDPPRAEIVHIDGDLVWTVYFSTEGDGDE